METPTIGSRWELEYDCGTARFVVLAVETNHVLIEREGGLNGGPTRAWYPLAIWTHPVVALRKQAANG